jgi:hypothetical protein
MKTAGDPAVFFFRGAAGDGGIHGQARCGFFEREKYCLYPEKHV